MKDDSAPEGIDRTRLTDWLTNRLDAVDAPLRFELVQGGRSNLTFVITDEAGRRWVLRRPPLHSVLPSAHDMSREHRIMDALAGTPVPVPAMIGYEPDRSVIGAEFFVMSYMDGHVIRDDHASREILGEVQRRRAGISLIDVLAELHTVDPDEVGLDDFAKKEDYIARQLHRLHGQLRRGREQYGARQLDVLDEVHDGLLASIPEQGPATIVHGDYRLDNVIVGDNGQVRAVLDWELCTLGDPLADVGMLAVFWADTPEEVVPRISSQMTVAGFPSRGEALARYSELSGRDLSQLDYYIAFACWKLAVILEGVYARFASGAYGETEDQTWTDLDKVVVRLGSRGRRTLGQ